MLHSSVLACATEQPLWLAEVCDVPILLLQDAENNWQFDIFGFAEATKGATLSLLFCHFMKQSGIIQEFQLDGTKLCQYAQKIESGYDANNPYHNRLMPCILCLLVHSVRLHTPAAPHFPSPSPSAALRRSLSFSCYAPPPRHPPPATRPPYHSMSMSSTSKLKSMSLHTLLNCLSWTLLLQACAAWLQHTCGFSAANESHADLPRGCAEEERHVPHAACGNILVGLGA